MSIRKYITILEKLTGCICYVNIVPFIYDNVRCTMYDLGGMNK